MSIQYQPSAAGISWQAMSEALKNRAEMQKALYELSATNSTVQINLTKMSADQTEKELNDQANAQLASAIGQIVGAAAGVATSGFIFAKQTSLLNESAKLDQITNNKVTYKEDDTILPENANAVPLKNMGSASVEGELQPPPTITEATKPQRTKTEPKLNDEQQALQQKAKSWGDYGNMLSSAANQTFTSVGGMVNARYTKKQAENKALESMQGSIAGIMKSQNDMLSAALGSADTNANNTEQTITSIISVSAVRG